MSRNDSDTSSTQNVVWKHYVSLTVHVCTDHQDSDCDASAPLTKRHNHINSRRSFLRSEKLMVKPTVESTGPEASLSTCLVRVYKIFPGQHCLTGCCITCQAVHICYILNLGWTQPHTRFIYLTFASWYPGRCQV